MPIEAISSQSIPFIRFAFAISIEQFLEVYKTT